jgi:16S rRNA (uracil1498-N3)-methyltransferase
MNSIPPRTQAAPRFFCPGDLAPGAIRDLPDQAAHHAARVLRLAPGDPVRLFNGDGAQWDAQIATVHKSNVAVRVGMRSEWGVEAPLRVVLAQAISSRERMDFTIQKAVELGVAEIWPLETRRSVVRLREERASRRVEHWQNLVIAACEQCGRNLVPQVRAVESFDDWLGALPRTGGSLRVMLSPGATLRLRDLSPPAEVLLLAGPEGGLDPDEREIAGTCGFQAVRLGPRTLRTETAALAAVAAMHALWGDF